jgi:polyphosphate kinase
METIALAPERRGTGNLAENALLNRELSWIEFNSRVLDEALDPSQPLLERLKFLSIFSTNLDEFFMVRVSGLQEQLDANPLMLSPDGLSAATQLKQISERLRSLLEVQMRCLLKQILPGLEHYGVRIVPYGKLNKEQRARLSDPHAPFGRSEPSVPIHLEHQHESGNPGRARKA